MKIKIQTNLQLEEQLLVETIDQLARITKKSYRSFTTLFLQPLGSPTQISHQAKGEEHHEAVRVLNKAGDIITPSMGVQASQLDHTKPAYILRTSKHTKAHHEDCHIPEDKFAVSQQSYTSPSLIKILMIGSV